ncbi:response regulator [Candidatus Omnitrophota bacterium]
MMVSLAGKAKKILIVEDDRGMQQIYRDMFKERSRNYTIEIKDDAESAIKRLEQEAFDLIILDIIMEPMGGDSFFVYLRRGKMLDVPILVVSVLSPSSLKNLKKIDHVSFLQKPIKEDQLFKRIKEILK